MHHSQTGYTVLGVYFPGVKVQAKVFDLILERESLNRSRRRTEKCASVCS